MRRIAAFALALAMGIPLFAQTPAGFRHTVYNASLKLNHAELGLEAPMSVCTATAFRKVEKGYLLVTAAHCVVKEGTAGGAGPYYAPLPDGRLSVEYGNPGERHIQIPVLIQSVGNWHEGWDVAILSAETNLPLTVIPLGDDTKMAMGDPVVSVSAPLDGSIKLWLEGYISAKMDQIEPDTPKNQPIWRNTVLLQLPGDLGSSGAPVVSPDQRAIVGIFVGIYRGPEADIVATCMVPASSIKAFMADPRAHTGIVPNHRAK